MIRFSIHPRLQAHLHVRPTLWMPMVAMVAFLAIYLPVSSKLVQITSPQPTVAAAPVSRKTAAPATAPTAAAAPVPVAAVHISSPAAAFPNCSPMSFGEPSRPALSGLPAGLNVQADAPTQYQIYGNTAAELRAQIARCAPGASGSSSAEFTAETSYAMTWQYYITSGSNGCTISNVTVGVHTAMAMPLWQPTANATSGLAARWQSFMNALLTHETGHATLDKAYGAKIVADLNGLGTISCDSVSATVNSVVNADVSALNNANDNYDAATNHGATQGAVLPSY